MTVSKGNRCFPMRIYALDPPTYSPCVQREKYRKRMNSMEINGGHGSKARVGPA